MTTTSTFPEHQKWYKHSCLPYSHLPTDSDLFQLPLSLLNAAQNKPMVGLSIHLIPKNPIKHYLQLVELKNGETFNGHLVNCDNFMNITLREVYQTTADGERFWKLKECYIRGSTVRIRFSGLCQCSCNSADILLPYPYVGR